MSVSKVKMHRRRAFSLAGVSLGFAAAGLFLFLLVCSPCYASVQMPSYKQLRTEFAEPDYARWGEVPLWWWEGDPLSKDRVKWQLETLAEKGVKSVCVIQRSPMRCRPQSFSNEYWDMLGYVNEQCRRLGMHLWAYDQVGYGHYGWLEKAAARAGDSRTAKIKFLTAEAGSGQTVRLELPEGTLVGARAYPMTAGSADDEKSIDIRNAIHNGLLVWQVPDGLWRVAVSQAVPYQSFYLSSKAADTFIDMLYGKLERLLGAESMGTTFAGVFQDEHPPTPRDVYTKQLAETFRQRCGYDISRAIAAMHFDVGPRTPMYRTDFLDVYLDTVEKNYWRRVFDWTWQRGILTSHDNWGRQNIYRQSQGYIDYFRTQRWFSAPGNDDYSQAPVVERNYYDTKLASSIARLYNRPRVWLEAFHSSGWGRTTNQTLSWLSAHYAFGANLYDEHGLYYSTRASTWEHAAPDPHWRQPYWRYYQTISDWVARMSYIMSQGTHVCDAAVHYPVVSLLAGEPPKLKGPDYNEYMKLSRSLYDAGIDNDIADDDSIVGGTVTDGKLTMAGNEYQALVFGPETTVRRSVLQQALRLVRGGGVVIFFGRLPVATAEAGRDDPRLTVLLQQIVGTASNESDSDHVVTRRFASGGFSAFVPADIARIAGLVGEHIERDFVALRGQSVFVNHRRIGNTDVYLVQNTAAKPIELKARFRVDGVPELWDAFTGKAGPVDSFERKAGCTVVEQKLKGNIARLVVLRPGSRRLGRSVASKSRPVEKSLSKNWTFSVIPTRDNLWGEFRWPPSDEVIGPEVRAFKYAEETAAPGTDLGWHQVDFDESKWGEERYSIGPYWLRLGPLPAGEDIIESVLNTDIPIEAGVTVQRPDKILCWQNVEFSQKIGLAKPTPWGGHSGYPDGSIDRNFVDLPRGSNLLFTRIRSPKQQRLGLRVELRNSGARLWVNGTEQPFEDAVGHLPLEKGRNSVLLWMPDGGHGRLFVQARPPSVQTMEEAARGMVQPDLRNASWIWTGSTNACYVRKSFGLKQVPAEARLVVTADSGYRLFVNGVKIEEEIGPWANWTRPERFNIQPHLQNGENVIAVWIQDLGIEAGFSMAPKTDARGLLLAMKMRDQTGRESEIVTDATWKGSIAQQTGWQQAGFDDSAWANVTAVGKMSVEPWGLKPLENLGAVTEPKRRLAINLPSPYLTCFGEVADIVYDVKPDSAGRVGWYRFQAPPGLSRLDLHTEAPARVWVNGVEVSVEQAVAKVAEPPMGVSQVSIRLEMQPGAYGGAAFTEPIALHLKGGQIQTGCWADYAMPTYSGIGVYKQTVSFNADQADKRVVLDLGQVLVAAEVLVNGTQAGVRLARPFTFDLTGLVRPGDNTLEIRIANTIAPHYTVTNWVHNLGPTSSGLVGPVHLVVYEDVD